MRHGPKEDSEEMENDGQEHPNAGWIIGTNLGLVDTASLWVSILVFVNMTHKNQEMIEKWFSQQGLFLGLCKHSSFLVV